MKWSGTCTALITPFLDNRVDEEGLSLLLERQLHAGVEGILLLGTTGEAATLSEKERQLILKRAVATTKGKATLFVGTGTHSTEETVRRTQQAEAEGADIALIVTPYYNKPTQEGIYRHFERIVSQTTLPLFVYNIPGRSGVNIETSTLQRLAALPRIVGVKEASGNLVQAADIAHQLLPHTPHFTLLSGEDGLTLPMMALGASGVISVISNLFPKEVVALVQSMQREDLAGARALHEELLPFVKLAFLETNPIPIKTALSLCGLPSGGCRLPLCELRPENQAQLLSFLKNKKLYQTEPRSVCVP